MSGLVDAVTVLRGRDLTPEESKKLAKFQEQQSIGDDDPVVAILALLGVHKILIEEIPDRIKKASQDAITVHEQTLREQSTIIAKELLLALTRSINDAARAQRTWRDRAVEYALVALIAVLVGGCGAWLAAKAMYGVPAAAVVSGKVVGKVR